MPRPDNRRRLIRSEEAGLSFWNSSANWSLNRQVYWIENGRRVGQCCNHLTHTAKGSEGRRSVTNACATVLVPGIWKNQRRQTGGLSVRFKRHFDHGTRISGPCEVPGSSWESVGLQRVNASTYIRWCYRTRGSLPQWFVSDHF